MLLIADEHKGIALAGIMGGQNTEINNATKDVLIESAYFKPTNIRRTSKALELRSESSYRFERGCDLGITDWASRRCAQLILQTAGGQLVPGVADAFPQPPEPWRVTLRPHKVAGLLGVSIPAAEQVRHLESLGLRRESGAVPGRVPFVEASIDTATLLKKEVVATGQDATMTFVVPSWRVDLKREADLIEEVGRMHGVDRIPSTPPRGAVGVNDFDGVYDQIGDARRILTGLGLSEAQGQTLIGRSEAQGAPENDLVPLANPLSSDMDVLRPSLLPGLLNTLRHNLSRRNEDIALFEIGRVFTFQRGADGQERDGKRRSDRAEKAGGLPQEERRVAIALTGQRAPNFWSGDDREAKFDLHDLKGLLEEFLEQFGLRGVTFARRAESSAWFLESAAVALGGKLALGQFGQLLPALAKRYDLRDAVLLAELNLDQLLARRNAGKSFKPLPQFPAIRRDVAMLVDEAITHEGVLDVIRKTKPAHLESVELFDVFRGKNVPLGKKSVAYAFTYRAPDRTLTDAEVNAAHEKLVGQFKESLSAGVRES
jgi:phenylalanyl-tRNA synthetase beta chain